MPLKKRNPKQKTQKRVREESASDFEAPKKRRSREKDPKQDPDMSEAQDKPLQLQTRGPLALKRPRTWEPNDPPITNYNDVPVGWSMDEPDIHQK
jgi:hypothetical protein